MAPENLQSSIRHILANGGTLKDAGDFVSLATALQKAQATSTAPKLNSTQLQQANNAQSGLSALQTIGDQISNNSNILLRAGLPTNIARNVAGAGSFVTARKEAADVISRLRTGAAINKEEEKFYQSQLPQFGDSPEAVQYKIGLLTQLFNRFANPEAAQPDLASALSAMQNGQ
jgi:hypothetical protein